MPGKQPLKLRPIAAAPSSTDVRKKKKPSTDPRTISSIVDDPAGTSGELAPKRDRLQATLTKIKRPREEQLATIRDLKKPVSSDDSAIHAFMNDVRAGDGAGARARFQRYTEQNIGRGKKRKP